MFEDFYNRYMPFSQKWLDDKIQIPTRECTSKSIRIFEIMKNKYNLLPHRISPSIAEGIYLYYIPKIKSKLSLSIEVYNDNLDVVALVTDGDAVLFSEEIKDFNFDEPINLFMESVIDILYP